MAPKTDVIAELRARVLDLEREDSAVHLIKDKTIVAQGDRIAELEKQKTTLKEYYESVFQDGAKRIAVAREERDAAIALRDGVINKLDDEYENKLSAQQLVIQQMRSAIDDLYEYASPWNHIESANCECDPSVGYICSGCRFANSEVAMQAKKALTLQPSTEALDAYVAEKVKKEREECAKFQQHRSTHRHGYDKYGDGDAICARSDKENRGLPASDLMV